MNNKLLFGIWLCIAFTQTSFSQEAIPGVRWQKNIGGSFADGGIQFGIYDSVANNPKSLLKTRDGGFIIGGRSNSNDRDAMVPVGQTRLVLIKTDSVGTVLWRNFFGNYQQPNLFGEVIEAIGGGYLFVGTARAGDDTDVLNTNADDVLVAKINEEGVIEWQHKFGGTGSDRGYAVLKLGNTGYLVTGYTESTDGHALSQGKGGSDLWLLSLDLSGNLLNEKKYGGTANEYGAVIINSKDGGYVIGGTTNSNDGDVTSSKGAQDVWLLKLDGTTSVSWSKVMGGSNIDIIQDLKPDMDGGYIFSGTTLSTNGDVTGNHGLSDAWVGKVNSSGALIWQRSIGGSDEESGNSILVKPGPYYFVTGSTRSNNGDITGPKGYTDIFLSNLGPTGEMLWTKNFGGSSNEVPYVITADGDQDLSLFGMSYSADGDLSVNFGFDDLWLVRLGSTNTISGKAFYDLNLNGIKDGAEVLADNIQINVEKPGWKKTAMTLNGAYTIDVEMGEFTITPQTSQSYYNLVPASTSKTFGSYFNTETIDFALQPVPEKQDLTISLSAGTPARPGFFGTYILSYKNAGTVALNASIELLLDPLLQFTGSSEAASGIDQNKIVWNLPTLQIGASGIIGIDWRLATPPTANNGDTLKTKATISPTDDDLTPVNNTSKLNQIVVGSYDPNDKQENNGGIITPQQVSAGEPLTYMIRFQNTGTDTAFTVVIRDTLADKVLPASLQIVNASHPYRFEIKNDNQLTWTFNNIDLVDSNKNEPLSHGFVAYQIKPLPSLSVGDTVKNSASIYFDYNLPVITNTEITILKNLLALPVKLGYFKAFRTNAGVDLLWRIVQQSKFSHFEIEKSFNGSSFFKLARLDAGRQEVINSVSDYRYTDHGSLQPNNYYRLKMIDIDGSFEYSHVVLVHAGEDKTLVFSVYPNPANKQIKVDLDGDINGHLSIRIIDQLGRVQKTIDIGIQHTKSISMPVSIDTLSPGTYFLQLKLDQKNFTKKIVIK